MLAGAIMHIPREVRERLNGCSWVREEDDTRLTSTITINNLTYPIWRNEVANDSVAIHEYFAREKRARQDAGNLFITNERFVTRAIIHMYVAPRMILVDNRDNRISIRQTISNALGVPYERLPFSQIDLPRMSRDYPEQWVRQFINREGRINRGSVYGDDVMRDAVFGGDLRRVPARSLGSKTRYFSGGETPFRVTIDGVVIVFANPEISDFLRFIEREILPYENEV